MLHRLAGGVVKVLTSRFASSLRRRRFAKARRALRIAWGRGILQFSQFANDVANAAKEFLPRRFFSLAHMGCLPEDVFAFNCEDGAAAVPRGMRLLITRTPLRRRRIAI